MNKKAIAAVLAGVCLMSRAAFAAYTDPDTVKAVQTALNAAGFDCGTVDGLFGSKTSGAIRSYQEKKGLEVNGQIEDSLLEAMNLKNAAAITEQWKKLLQGSKHRPIKAGFMVTEENTEEEIVDKIRRWMSGLEQISIADLYTVQAVRDTYESLPAEARAKIEDTSVLEAAEKALRGSYLKELGRAGTLLETAQTKLEERDGVAGLRAAAEAEVVLQELAAFGQEDDEAAAEDEENVQTLSEMRMALDQLLGASAEMVYPGTGLMTLDTIAEVKVSDENTKACEGYEGHEDQFYYAYSLDKEQVMSYVKAYRTYLESFFTRLPTTYEHERKDTVYNFQDDLGNLISVAVSPQETKSAKAEDEKVHVYILFDRAIALQRLHEYHGVNPLAGKPLAYAAVGDKVCLGSYEQDQIPDNGGEALMWSVAAADEDGLKLLCETVIETDIPDEPGEAKAYSAEGEEQEGTNDTSSRLLNWLNDEFRQSVFTDQERSLIRIGSVEAESAADDEAGTGKVGVRPVLWVSVQRLKGLKS